MDQVAQTQRIEYCSVCGDKADGYHYGVLSCRGCNAFFRRAITYNLQFQCRRGGNCIVNRNARCACRACRLNKCKLVGMDRSAVQMRHDKDGNKISACSYEMLNSNVKHSESAAQSRLHDVLPSSSSVLEKTSASASASTVPLLMESNNFISISQKSSPQSCNGNCSATTLASPSSTFAYISSVITNSCSTQNNKTLNSKSSINFFNETFQSSSLCWPFNVFGSAAVFSIINNSLYMHPNEIKESENNSYLTKLMWKYFDQRRRRRLMLCTTLEEVLSEDCENRLVGPAGLNDFSAIYQVQMILMFEWVEKLTEFQQILNAHDKVRILRSFSMKYMLLDNIIYTLELGHLDRLVLPNNNFIQYRYLPPLSNCTSLEAHQAISIMYGENAIKIIDELVRPMAEMNFTYGEFMVLRLIMLWNPGSIGLTAETIEVVQRASQRALQELHNYFELHKLPELQNRLGSVLLLISPLAKFTKYLNEITLLISEFGILPEWNSFMNELLKD